MSARVKYGLRKWIVNAFGTLGYVAVVFGWLWTIILYLNFLKDFLVSVAPEVKQKIDEAPIVVPTDAQLVVGEGSLIGIIFAVVVTIAVVILTLYVLIKAPSVAIRTSQKIVHDTAEYVAPVVLKTQHITPTEPAVKKVTRSIMVIVKLAAVCIPAVLSCVASFVERPVIDSAVGAYGGLLLGAVACIFFGLQYLMAKVLSVHRSDIW